VKPMITHGRQTDRQTDRQQQRARLHTGSRACASN
jgi:hypothetical protein